MSTSKQYPHHADFTKSVKERQSRLTLVQELSKLAATKMFCELPPELSVALSNDVSQQGLSMRRLLESEVRTLSTVCRCRSTDWSKVKIILPSDKQGADQSSLLMRHVSDTNFEGMVILIGPSMTATPQSPISSGAKASLKSRLPMGIHSNAVVSNCMVYLNARVHRNSCVADTFIGSDAVVVNNGSISYNDASSQNIQNLGFLSLTVGPESGGGREIVVRPEDTLVHVVQQMADCTPAKPDLLPQVPVTMNILDYDTVVRDTSTVECVFMHPHSSIEGASCVKNAILCNTSKITMASTAQNVMLQWNAAVTEGSSLTNAFLMEEAHAGPHSILVSSVLGPDVHVSAGEIHASILGPNTNAHHQSLVIGVLWPLGRGNVGYGANVGSNHTGRLPDQECAAGEGTFWGLSSVIKFPVDLSAAPYSIVAAGTSIPPQRVTMPFSLIVTGSSGGNDIIPGWLLRSSPYTIARNETKYATRRKAIRHASYTGWKIVRGETVALCLEARTALLQLGLMNEEAQQPKEKIVSVESDKTNVTINTVITEPKKPVRRNYTERDIPGIGSNILSEKGRVDGIAAYTACIQRYALQGLLNFLLQRQQGEAGKRPVTTEDLEALQQEIVAVTQKPELVTSSANGGVAWNLSPWEVSEASEWEFQRYLLAHEFSALHEGSGHASHIVVDEKWLTTQLNLLVKLEQEYATAVFKSKHRDDQRGAEVIPGYAKAHTAAGDDPVIVQARAQATQLDETVKGLLAAFVELNSKL